MYSVVYSSCYSFTKLSLEFPDKQHLLAVKDHFVRWNGTKIEGSRRSNGCDGSIGLLGTHWPIESVVLDHFHIIFMVCQFILYILPIFF